MLDHIFFRRVNVLIKYAYQDAKAGKIKDLSAHIDSIRANYPEVFHNENSLKNRAFYNEPRTSIPCEGFLIPIRA